MLSALGETEMLSLLDEIPLPAFAHQKALELFKKYMLIGGMPEAVATYSITEDLTEPLRKVGISDDGILDATLGVSTEGEEGKSYNY